MSTYIGGINTTCSRCGDNTTTLKGSYFNTEMICLKCDDKERAHPQYKEAKDRELEECMKGNFNFEGIGKPADL